MQERWGTLSVKDHVATDKLITDILAYDRLVFPFPPNDEQRLRWTREGWDPDLLDKRLEQLGKQAIRVPWDSQREQQFSDKMKSARAVAADAKTIMPDDVAFQSTRQLLAENTFVLPKNVTRVITVAAFRSLSDLKANQFFSERETNSELLALLVRNRIAQPQFSDRPDEILPYAIQLSRDSEFQQNRRSLYRWQSDITADGVEPKIALEELEEMINRYNAFIKKSHRQVGYRLIFTIISIGTALAGSLLENPVLGVPFLISGVSAAASLVSFGMLDRTPVVNAGEVAPAAMFHEVETLP